MIFCLLWFLLYICWVRNLINFLIFHCDSTVWKTEKKTLQIQQKPINTMRMYLNRYHYQWKGPSMVCVFYFVLISLFVILGINDFNMLTDLLLHMFCFSFFCYHFNNHLAFSSFNWSKNFSTFRFAASLFRKLNKSFY